MNLCIFVRSIGRKAWALYAHEPGHGWTTWTCRELGWTKTKAAEKSLPTKDEPRGLQPQAHEGNVL